MNLVLLAEERRRRLLAAARDSGERLVHEARARADRERRDLGAAVWVESGCPPMGDAVVVEPERLQRHQERRRQLLDAARAEGRRLFEEALAHADRERLYREAAVQAADGQPGQAHGILGPHFHLARREVGGDVVEEGAR